FARATCRLTRVAASPGGRKPEGAPSARRGPVIDLNGATGAATLHGTDGDVAKWLGNGLQIRERGFDSRRHLPSPPAPLRAADRRARPLIPQAWGARRSLRRGPEARSADVHVEAVGRRDPER